MANHKPSFPDLEMMIEAVLRGTRLSMTVRNFLVYSDMFYMGAEKREITATLERMFREGRIEKFKVGHTTYWKHAR